MFKRLTEAIPGIFCVALFLSIAIALGWLLGNSASGISHVSAPFIAQSVEYVPGGFCKQSWTIITTESGRTVVVRGLHSLPPKGTKLVRLIHNNGGHSIRRGKE